MCCLPTAYTDSLTLDRLKQLDVKQVFGLPGKPEARYRESAVCLSDLNANWYRLAIVRLQATTTSTGWISSRKTRLVAQTNSTHYEPYA
jgi:hypothetical protein